MRAVALERPINRRPAARHRRRDRSSLGIVAAVPRACSASSGIAFVGLGALLDARRRVRALAAVRARSWRCVIGVPLTKIAGHRRQPVARERGAEPAAHGDDRRRGDDRRVARRLHHDLRRVGQRVDRLRDRPAAQDRLHRHAQGRRRRARRRVEPAARPSRSPRSREIEASTPIRLGARRGRRRVRRSSPPPTRRQSRSCSTSAPSRRLDGRPRHRTASASRPARPSSKHLKLGDLVPVKFVKTGVVPLQVEFIYKNNGLAGDYLISLANVRAELHRSSSTSRSSPSSSRA